MTHRSDREPSQEEREPGRHGDGGDDPVLREIIRARGHEHVSARHGSTLEVTTDDFLTPAGDCIVGIEADRAPTDLDPGFVAACRDASARIVAVLEAGGRRSVVRGRGDPALTFEDERGAVLRTSDYVDDRTVMVGADRAASDLERDLVRALSAGSPLRMTLVVETTGDGDSP